jgi:hypothetical protein
MSAENFADMMAEAIASRTVEHIKAYAELAGTAGPYPIEGTVS